MHRSLAAKIKKLDRRHIPDLLPEKTENIAKKNLRIAEVLFCSNYFRRAFLTAIMRLISL